MNQNPNTNKQNPNTFRKSKNPPLRAGDIALIVVFTILAIVLIGLFLGLYLPGSSSSSSSLIPISSSSRSSNATSLLGGKQKNKLLGGNFSNNLYQVFMALSIPFSPNLSDVINNIIGGPFSTVLPSVDPIGGKLGYIAMFGNYGTEGTTPAIISSTLRFPSPYQVEISGSGSNTGATLGFIGFFEDVFAINNDPYLVSFGYNGSIGFFSPVGTFVVIAQNASTSINTGFVIGQRSTANNDRFDIYSSGVSMAVSIVISLINNVGPINLTASPILYADILPIIDFTPGTVTHTLTIPDMGWAQPGVNPVWAAFPIYIGGSYTQVVGIVQVNSTTLNITVIANGGASYFNVIAVQNTGYFISLLTFS
jgi:hypothetical protein